MFKPRKSKKNNPSNKSKKQSARPQGFAKPIKPFFDHASLKEIAGRDIPTRGEVPEKTYATPRRTVLPPLTIEGKRELIDLCRKAMGDAAFNVFLHQWDIPGYQILWEQVRKHKARFFREMAEEAKLPPFKPSR